MIILPHAYVYHEEFVDEECMLKKILNVCRTVHVVDLYVELVEKKRSISEVIKEAIEYKNKNIVTVFKGFNKLVEKLGVNRVCEIIYDLANTVSAIYIIPYSLWRNLDLSTKSRMFSEFIVNKVEAQ